MRSRAACQPTRPPRPRHPVGPLPRSTRSAASGAPSARRVAHERRAVWSRTRARARSRQPARRPHAPAELRGAGGPAAPACAREPARPDARRQAPLIADSVGAPGEREDHDRPIAGRHIGRVLRSAQRCALRRQGGQGGHAARRRRAKATGQAHDPLRGRDPSLQQGAAGRVPLPRREG